MDFIFLGAGSSNGYDALGHFLRTEGVGNVCLAYAVSPSQRLRREAVQPSASGSSASATAASSATRIGEAGSVPPGTSVVMARTLDVLRAPRRRRRSPTIPASVAGEAPSAGSGSGSSVAAGALDGASGAGSGAAPRPTAAQTPAPTLTSPSPKKPAPTGMLLNYLLGD